MVFKANLSRALASRLKIGVWCFISVFTPILMLGIFSQYYRSGGTIPGYTFEQMVAYYLAVVIVSVWISKVATNITTDIREGNLSNFITKPIDYIFYRIPWEISWWLVSSVFTGLPLIILIALGNSDLIIPILNLFGDNLLKFIPTIFFSYLISFFLSATIGFSAFFITETSGIENGYEAVIELVSGKLLPLAFFPPVILNLIQLLPFGYIVYFPSQVLIGKIVGHDYATGLMVQILWVIVTYCLARFVWNRGIKKFSAVGL